MDDDSVNGAAIRVDRRPDGPPRPQGGGGRNLSYVEVAVFVAITAAYFYSAVYRSAHTPLWMDEVLTVTAAGQSDYAGVLRAIWAGTDFSPPTFHFLLHAMQDAGLRSLLALRLPSILAVYGAGLCMYVIADRRFAPMISLAAFGMTVASPLFDYAVQVRQYGLIAFLLAAALALWDGPGTGAGRSILKPVGIWAAIAGCVSLHFYGVVAAAAIGVCEALWTLFNRKVRVSIWLALAAVGPVVLAWMPLAVHLHHISAADQVGPGFYGYPAISRLCRAIIDLTVGQQPQIVVYGGAILAILVSRLRSLRGLPISGAKEELTEFAPRQDRNLIIILITLAAIPVIAYGLGTVATGSFVTRYAMGAALFPGLALACALSAINRATASAVLVFPFVVLSLLAQATDTIRGPAMAAAFSLLHEQPRLSPVVIGDGLLYIEMVGGVSPADRARIVYLAGPDESANPDPTNENAVRRLSSFDGRFRYVSFNDAFRTHGRIYVLRTMPEATDMAFQEMVRRRLLGGLIAEKGPAQMYVVEPHSFRPPHF